MFHRAECQREEHFIYSTLLAGVRINPASSVGCPGPRWMPCSGCPGRGRGTEGGAGAPQEVIHVQQLLGGDGKGRETSSFSTAVTPLCPTQLCWSSARHSSELREGSAHGCSCSKKGLCTLPTNISQSAPSTQPALPTANLKPAWTPAQLNSPHFSLGQSLKVTCI